ncbi:AmmeMemoRadiSam system radical SAM enzyme [uncultured Thiohalocapsa sp.]|uniref:AmmeMemoRadiSam system radical SAM enzyme n=1 Tax=uncultured Thiohalocapsa sp. TaxID=768990 RepID=UPI0025D0FE8B|nr:AmmeMemoRadiSam system radical SAM enzyme [uncultured Thiohalocapsa sp.]
MSAVAAHPTQFWHRLDDGRVQCDVCPRACVLKEGQRGLCFVRGCQDGAVVLHTYGRSSGFCIDPIEKKPLFHFLPGTPVLSFGTAGCNLTCRFCQNWDMSKSRAMDTLATEASPQGIAHAAAAHGCRSVAYTYNDPVIFLEYACDTAAACRALGIRNVAVTAGYIAPGARETFFACMDAANIDLKAFTDAFYKKLCSAHLDPVLETIEYVHKDTDVWLELTTLIIPGHNDSDAEIARMAAWVVEHLGPDVPMHFSAFHPAYRMRELPPTPPATLTRARRVAMDQGVRYAYTGNVQDGTGGSTFCHACGELLIARDWYQLGHWGLTADGRCAHCGTACAGVFEAEPGHWGARRLPLAPSALAQTT